MIDAGANVQVKSSGGRNLLTHASTGHVNAIRMIKVLLAFDNLEVDSQDVFGQTPLMYAAQAGAYEVVLQLLKAGADRGVKNQFGQTALDIARNGGGNKALIRLLENGGPGFNLGDDGKHPRFLL